jgi:hypothetical protein
MEQEFALPPPKIVNLAAARGLIKLKHESRDVLGMDVVTDLFRVVAENSALLTLKIALHQIA